MKINAKEIEKMVKKEEDQRKSKRLKKKSKKANGFFENPIKPKKADTDKDNDKETDKDIADVVAVYENNIAPATGFSLEILTDYCEELSPELVKEAIRKAVLANNRSMKYIRGILNSWAKKGFKTVIDVKNEEEQFRKAKENRGQNFETEEEKMARRIKELEEAQLNDDS